MGYSRVGLEELIDEMRKRKAEFLLIIDTNMMLDMMRGVPVREPLEEELGARIIPVTTKTVLEELERLARDSNSLKILLKTRLGEILSDILVLDSVDRVSADRDIEALALRLKNAGVGVVVATNDKRLRKRLRDRGIDVAFFRWAHKRVQSSLGRTI